LICDYNRDGDSHRSPWTNTYDPPIDDGFLPSDNLRQLEVEANTLFDAYRELYFEGGGQSSVYLWDQEDGFAGCFLIKKDVEGERVQKGTWNSIHIIEVQEESASKATYKLTTTILLDMGFENDGVGSTNMSGTLTRQAELTCEVNVVKTHIANMGGMIEDMESTMRANMNKLYLEKTHEVIFHVRTSHDAPITPTQHVEFLNAAVMAHAKKKTVVE
jgi:capping protein beta